MKVIFLSGSSGSGKSHYLYKKLLEISENEPERRLFLVVPEQFTMQAQKNIVDAAPGHGTFNIDIVSFNRLAYRVFGELGISLLATIDDTGKNLVLRRVIEEKKKELTVIRPKDTQGFVSEIKSVISELLQYSVTPNMLKETADRLDGIGLNNNKRLRGKINDICLLYEGFKSFIDSKFITAEEITEILCGCIGSSQIVKDAVFAFDGFTGFTPVQYRLIEILMGLAGDMYFTVTMANDHDENLFSMSTDMMRRIGERADKCHVFTETVVIGGEVPCRFKASPALAYLEKNIFRNKGEYKGVPEGIEIFSAFGRKAEAKFVAAKINSLVRSGYRYKDIGVIVSSMDDYRELISNAFAESGIPAFMDRKRSILANPAVEYIRSAIDVIDKDFSYEAVFRFLKTWMCPIDISDVDLLENYILATGIRGYKKWSDPFKRLYHGIDEEVLSSVNATRDEFVNLMAPLREVLSDRSKTVGDYVTAIEEFVCAADVCGKLSELEKEMEDKKRFSIAKEYGQSYEDITTLFAQTKGLLGDEKMTVRQLAQVLDAGFNELKVGIIPPTIDMVMVGDVTRTRLDHIKVLIFIGVNEGRVPEASGNKGLFSEWERQQLESADLELAPTPRKKAYMQNFYLYLLLTKPSDQLIFTVNKEEKASKLVAELMSLFPLAKRSRDDSISHLEMVANDRDGMEFILDTIKDRELHDDEKAYYYLLSQNSDINDRLDSIINSVMRKVSDDDIGSYAARLLYGDVLRSSVSRIEQYAKCAFSHFAKYGLRLSERKIYDIAAADLGTLYHDVLKIYSKKLAVKKLKFSDVPADERVSLVEASVDEAMADYNNSIFNDSTRNQYKRNRIKDMMQFTAWALGQEEEKQFIPTRFESAFKMSGENMEITGKIDRVDFEQVDGKVYARVVDYKSGEKKFDFGELYDGLMLQLMVYLHSLTNSDTKPKSAGYYVIKSPVIDSVEPDIKRKLIAEVQLKEVSASEEQLGIMGRYAMNRMAELGHEILGGSAAPNPYDNSCEYCDFKCVCGFDDTNPNAEYRVRTMLKDADTACEKYLERMGEDGKTVD